MLARRQIFICGQSIFTQAIAANLTARLDVELHHFNAHLPHIADRLLDANPTLVILEQGDKPDNIALTLMLHSQPLLMLNTQTGKAVRFTGQEMMVTELNTVMAFDDL